jgi:hypothetical protein
MTFAAEDGTTSCPRCADPLVFRLDAIEGGGLRYDVSCPTCDEVYFEMSTPMRALPAAA